MLLQLPRTAPRPPDQRSRGGYNLTVLADCVEDHLRLLLGEG